MPRSKHKKQRGFDAFDGYEICITDAIKIELKKAGLKSAWSGSYLNSYIVFEKEQ